MQLVKNSSTALLERVVCFNGVLPRILEVFLNVMLKKWHMGGNKDDCGAAGLH